MTFSELTDHWMKTKAAFVKDSTFAAYLLVLKNHIIPRIGAEDISTINRVDIQQFAATLLARHLAIKTVKDIMIVVKMILAHGAENELMSPLVYSVKYPSKHLEEKREIVVYSKAEQNRIADYISKNPSAQNLAILLVLCTGMRIGEICGLTWGNIDLENKFVLVRTTMQRIYAPDKITGKWKTSLVSGTPKTADSSRAIPIPSPLVKILKDYRKTVKEEYYVNSCTRKPIEPRIFRNYYVKLIKEDVGLDRCLKFHGLRHTFATNMIESGADLKTTSSILGHSNVTLTMNLYVHPTEESKSASVNKAMKGLFR